MSNVFFQKIKSKKIIKKYNLNTSAFLNYKRKFDGIENKTDKIKILFLGSSEGNVGINSDFWDDGSAYNLCIDSQDLYYSYKLYEQYASKLHNLEQIIITYSTFSSGNEIYKNKKSLYLAYYYEKIFEIKHENIRNNASFLKDMDFFEKFILTKYAPPHISYSGYSPYLISTENTPIQIVSGYLKTHFKLTNQEKWLIKASELASKYNHKLYVVITPNPKNTISLYKKEIEKFGVSYEDLFKPLYDLEIKNVSILNYFDCEAFKEFHFSDPTHLTPQGAIKLTKFIIEDINHT